MLQDFLRKPSVQPIAIGCLIIVVGVAGYSIFSSVTGGEVERAAGGRMYVDSKTNQSFYHVTVAGEKMPVKAPSGEAAGYPAEACYWTKEGTIKTDPTYVLLNGYIAKPGPTFCPDCGRLVLPMNLHPHPGDKAPPLKSEIGTRRIPIDQ